MQRFKRYVHPLKPLLLLHRSLHHDFHLQTAGPLSSLLKTRSVIHFSGPDTLKFLQSLVTNDVRRFDKPANENLNIMPTPNMTSTSVPPMYTALLTPQGRFMCDFFLYQPPRLEDKLDPTGSGPGSDSDESVELFADVDQSVSDELICNLKRVRLRSKVEIENVAGDFDCWQRYGGSLSEKSSEEPEASAVGWGGGFDRSGELASSSSSSGWNWHKDPRLDCLGFRGIFPSGKTPPLVEADKETVEENYLLWRLEKGVAEGPIEIPKGEAIPLEYNLVGLNAISFDKGCYVGQELVARTHHRGVIRKRLVPLKFLGSDGKEAKAKVAPGSAVADTSSGKKVGTVTTALGCRGMGVLRLDDAFKGLLTIQGQDDIKVETIRPEWWPSDWFPDHQHSAAA